MSFFSELKRRNVVRVAIAYLAGAWLLTEVAGTLFPMFGLGDAPARIVVILLAIVFPLFLVFSWVFEFTTEGLKLEKDIDRKEPVTRNMGKQLDRILIVLLALSVGYFAIDKFVLEPARVAEIASETAHYRLSARVAGQDGYDVPSIAVMPMEILTDDADVEYLAKAVGEDLLLRLKFTSFRIISVRDTPADLGAQELGRLHDVDYIWYRTIAREQDDFRVTKRLVETVSGIDIVSYQHTIEGSERFGLQDQLARFSHEFTMAVLDGEAKRLKGMPVDGMNAWELIHKPTESIADARANVERAYALYPNDYGANSVLSAMLQQDVVFQRSSDIEGDKAKALELARRGYALAPNDEYAIQMLCATELGFGDPDLALRYARKLGALKSFAAAEYYLVLIGNGLADEALAHATKNPLIQPKTMGHIYLHLDRFAEAEDAYRQQLADTPDNVIVWFFLANALGYEGKLQAGRDIMQKVDQVLSEAGQPRVTRARWEIGLRLTWGDRAYEKFVDGLTLLGIW